jgi:tetratricopeptide (TPR) repeat protein
MKRRTAAVSIAAEAALGLLLLVSPLLLGGAPVWALWPACALAGAALVLAAAAAARQGHSLRIPLAAALPGIPAALCLLQLVPLPPPLLALLSPDAAELREFALVPLGLDGWRPVTLDAPATWRELAKHLAYAATLVAALEVARSRRARGRLLAYVALSGTVVAVTGIAHKVANARAVFGLYAFQEAQPPILTPFGNANHLAAFLTVTGAVALGLTARSSGRRPGWGLAFLAIAAVTFLSLSRGGVVSFVLGLLLFGAMLWLKDRGRRALYAAAAGALGLAVAAGVAVDRLWAEFAAGGASKTDTWPMLARAAGRFWALGMGRGAFEPAFARYQTELAGFRFTHAENAVLQLGAELGVAAAAGLVALAALVWARAAARKELWTAEVAALAGLAALAAHELFDFSLELPPTALVACALLGTVARAADAGPGDGEPPPAPVVPRGWRLQGRWAAAAAVATPLAALLALVAGRHTTQGAEARLEGLLAAGAPLAEVRAAVLEEIDRHPAHYRLPALAAQGYARAGAPQEALAFVNRALFLRPMDAASHRIAARSLLRLRRRSQAFLEYRLAIQAGDGGALREAVPLARTAAELEQLCPDDAAVAEDAVFALVAAGRVPEATALARAMAARLEGHAGASRLWAQLVSLEVSQHHLEAAEEALRRLRAAEPESARTAVAAARVLGAQGRTAEAVAALQAQSNREPGNEEVAFLLAEQLLASGSPRAAREALGRVAPFLVGPDARARMFHVQGRAFEQEGRFAKALDAYQTAVRLRPGRAELHYAVARMHEEHRQPGAAAREVQEGMKVDSPQGAAAARPWVDRLLAQERDLLDRQATQDQQARERLLNDRMLEAEMEEER